ncbi:MAG: bifunctional [glutamate--ammonia ligase]-adenylyl-L-tyrosine phosphorylase/[glutamate--ammonia-ligase] adenylyltransferase [Thermodesulfovibrionales bacterium]|nr:bifunctional [glutamate--ammonia ligase]-adenylyl-L-tyrosine phosphorylase/[glutamate--ammonia-ligase] adenylyltransferase [Thermodesulfovibrionales bacterium]
MNYTSTFDLPDPERAENNIKTFIERNPTYIESLLSNLYPISLLFSCSQFLANYSIKSPNSLFQSLGQIENPIDVNELKGALREKLLNCHTIKEGFSIIRNYKKDKLLIITLRDLLRRTTLQETTFELTMLADTILSESLEFVKSFLEKRFGTLQRDSLVVIGLGKVGASELNYSSDVDLIFAHRDDNGGETSGLMSPSGVITNRITTLEFYHKLIEEYCRFLSLTTEDGFAYRVDLRLRPQGQRGSLILSLKGYEEYYESWGQMWERAAMIRARPITGDLITGEEFIRILQPFIYRKYLDFDTIDEIRNLKSQVEQIKPGTLSRDIKRGFGGIREIEFFVQIFQLIYGGREPLLREGNTLIALHRLLQKALIGYDDFEHLSNSYIFLRTLEHRLQQLNDLQTHLLPTNDRELEILSKKLDFKDRKTFLEALYTKRHKVREIYDSLLSVEEVAPKISKDQQLGYRIMSSIFWEMDSPIESLLLEELSKTKLKDQKRAIQYLTKIRNSIYSFQTLKGKRLLEEVIPRFVDEVLKAQDPDRALLQLVDFSVILAGSEPYLELLANRNEVISTLTFIFSNSEYLSRFLIKSPHYLESLVIGESVKKRGDILKKELEHLIQKNGISNAIRLLKRLEEIRLGILFLNKQIDIIELLRSLSKTAEILMLFVLKALLQNKYSSIEKDLSKRSSDLFIVGFGKLGGREITFDSDVDFIFICREEPTHLEIKNAEKFIRLISSYTKEGVAYKIDVRLRPDGTKGPLVSSLKGIENYYLHNAHPWELQALIKARPLGEDITNNRAFIDLRNYVLIKREREIKKDDIRSMVSKIQKELSKENQELKIYDIKYASGGLLELEFFIQYLQLKNCSTFPDILTQNTSIATKKLLRRGLINPQDSKGLEGAYLFYRTIETLLKLRSETSLKKDNTGFDTIASFLNLNSERFLEKFLETRKFVSDLWNKY